MSIDALLARARHQGMTQVTNAVIEVDHVDDAPIFTLQRVIEALYSNLLNSGDQLKGVEIDLARKKVKLTVIRMVPVQSWEE